MRATRTVLPPGCRTRHRGPGRRVDVSCGPTIRADPSDPSRGTGARPERPRGFQRPVVEPDPRPERRSDRGSVTAELAVALPALVLLLAGSLTAVAGVATKLRCVDAAREGALAAARGADGEAAARQAAPTGATIEIASDGDTVRATVRAQVWPLGRRGPGVTVGSDAVSAKEPGE